MWLFHRNKCWRSSSAIYYLFLARQFIYLVLLVGFGPSTTPAEAANVDIAWGFNIVDAQLNASVTDVLIFTYLPIHTVFSMPNREALEQCDFSEATELCGFADSPCSVSLEQFNTSSRAWIACSVHCESNDIRLTVWLSNKTKEYEYEYEYEQGPY